MIVFICGGSKSGKSHIAQDMAKALCRDNPLYYIATMIPSDSEDKEKIRLHLEDRDGMGFETVECGRNILYVTEKADISGTFLLDSVTALLANEMYGNFENKGVDTDAAVRCVNDIRELAETVENTVIVSDYIFSDAEIYDESTEFFRKALAAIGNSIAAYADIVMEMNYGIPTIHKGKQIYETVF